MPEKLRIKNISLEEVTDPKSAEFKKGVEGIYWSIFKNTNADEPKELAKNLRYQNSARYKASGAGREEELHVMVLKDESIKGSSADKIIGTNIFSYYPDKGYGVNWYLGIAPQHRGKITSSMVKDAMKRKVGEYAAKNGQKASGYFFEVEKWNQKAVRVAARATGGRMLDVDYTCPSLGEGRKDEPAYLFFVPAGGAQDMDSKQTADAVRTMYTRGYFMSEKGVEKNACYQKAMQSLGMRDQLLKSSSYKPRVPRI